MAIIHQSGNKIFLDSKICINDGSITELEAAIKTLKVELDGSIRIGAISPGWIAEARISMGMDEKQGMPAIEVAQAYIDYLNKTWHSALKDIVDQLLISLSNSVCATFIKNTADSYEEHR